MGLFTSVLIDWTPFTVCAPGEKAPYPRALSTPEGLGDRLRFVAFAEKQATHAFATAALVYKTAPASVRELWMELSREEEKHLALLVDRMKELNISVEERPQSLALWQSFDRCQSPREFADFMQNAEERGRQGGEKFFETLLSVDPVTAKLFKKIADEEVVHIRLATTVLQHL